MAADVDKSIPEEEKKIAPQNGKQSPGSRSWICRGMWTWVVVCAVPLFAFGIKYYQDARLLKRHVRPKSVIMLYHSLTVISTWWV